MTPVIPTGGRRTFPRALIIAVSALCVGGTIFLLRGTLREATATTEKPMASTAMPAAKSVESDPVAITNRTAQPSQALHDNAEEAALQARIRAKVISDWRKAAPGFEHMIKVDLPKALAERKVNAPYYNAFMAFGRNYAPNHAVAQAGQTQGAAEKASADLLRADPQAQEHYPGIDSLSRCVNCLLLKSDPTPIDGAGAMTVGSLAREMDALPVVNANLRYYMAQVERLTFADEQAAQQVEALDTNAKIDAYLQAGARDRYVSAYQQMQASLPVDQSVKDYYDGEAKTRAVTNLTARYEEHWNAGVSAMIKDYEDQGARAQVILMQSPDDDAESRQVRTELVDLGQQIRKAMKAGE